MVISKENVPAPLFVLAEPMVMAEQLTAVAVGVLLGLGVLLAGILVLVAAGALVLVAAEAGVLVLAAAGVLVLVAAGVLVGEGVGVMVLVGVSTEVLVGMGVGDWILSGKQLAGSSAHATACSSGGKAWGCEIGPLGCKFSFSGTLTDVPGPSVTV